MKRSGSLKRRPRRRSPAEKAASEAWHAEVCRRVIDGELLTSATEEYQAGLWGSFAGDCHHIIYRQVVRSAGGDEWDARNGIAASETRHRRIHNGREPLRWSELSAERQAALTEFATEFGLTAWLERHLEGFPV